MWASILSLAVSVVGFILKRVSDNEAMQTSYQAFVQSMVAHAQDSVAAHDAFEKEKADLEKPIDPRE